ncbi:hypothetical protein HJG54_16450 [Leptolyngbya sp. NK1-12]|uniref:Uncharacterized protein n=1 Tax=Leptolyngbya sp. NK1-12 TaxID=2547451 RepID=A0AA96WGQ6_9CYAN|nr:hypothetical protein [Leptolyngbya sp. NK1-12]WNZ24290.1 hypothetical protein HJG54_16450 [Leptolyngbya sp. NK1-12]
MYIPTAFREGDLDKLDKLVGEGKYKLSQNRSHADQKHVAHALLQSTDPSAHTIGVEMQRNLDGNECC